MVELEGNLSLFHEEKLELTKIGAQRRRAVQRERKPGTLRVPGQSGLQDNLFKISAGIQSIDLKLPGVLDHGLHPQHSSLVISAPLRCTSDKGLVLNFIEQLYSAWTT